MKRYEMVKLLSERSPFDLRFKDDYRLLLGVKTEVRQWCGRSELWQNVHYFLQNKNSLGENSETKEIDFRPIFSLGREAMTVVREKMHGADLTDLSDGAARMILASIIYHPAMDEYANLLLDSPVSATSIEGVRWILLWLQAHAFDDESMTEAEKAVCASL